MLEVAVVDIAAATAAAVAAQLTEGDPVPALEKLGLSDLVRLQRVLDELGPKLRGLTALVRAAGREQAAADVPPEGPIVGGCEQAVVHHIRAYVRDAEGVQDLAWSVTSCAVHQDAWSDRIRHVNGFAEVVILPLKLCQVARCGKVTDYHDKGW